MLDILTRLYKKPRLIILDLLLLNISLLCSFFFRFGSEWGNYWDYRYIVLTSLLGLGILYFSNLYNKIWRYASIQELYSIIKCSILFNSLFVVFTFFLRMNIPRLSILLNGVLTVFLLGGVRFLIRFLRDFLTKYRNGNGKKDDVISVLVVGAGDAGEMIVRELQKHPEMDKKVVGLIDDDPFKQNLEIHGRKVLGDRKKIPEIISKKDIDEVIIAIPSARGKEVKEIYEFCSTEGVNVKTVPGIYEILNGDVSLNQIREVKVEDLLRREPVQLNTDKISAYVKDRTVLISGGGGSIGSEISRQIARFEPEEVVLLDIYENNLYFLELELSEKYENINFVPVIGSIRDKNKLRQIFRDYEPDVVFHAAAHKHVPLMEHNPEEAVKNNIFGTRNLAETADEFGTAHFVLISTDKAVNPTNVMGATKRTAEMLIQVMNRKSATRFMTVRFGNVLGSQGSVIPLFKKQIAEGNAVTVTHPEIERYFMTIPEAAQLVIQAGALGDGGEVFVLDMGEPVKILELAEDLIRLSGLKPGVDIDIEITGLRPGEKLTEELLHESEGSLRTAHDKIFIQDLNSVKERRLNYNLNKLEKMVESAETEGIIETLIKIVGTYKPNRDNIKLDEETIERVEKEVGQPVFEMAVSE